jgi:arylsulfatase A-like enzyme
MFARWPGRIEAGASEQPVWLVDLMPTFAALAGTTPPAGIDGQNLMPLLGGRPAGFPPGRPFYWEWRGSQALRMGAWRAYKPAGKPTELYLITEDPQMERNMANQYRQVVEQVEAAFRREHRPSEWYWNPGETAAEFKAKQEKAKRLGVFRESELGNRK